MNLDNDYDSDGNNIVPCPICLDKYCPSKNDGKCPEEDEFVKAMTTPAKEWREEEVVVEADKVFDCFEDGCGECTVCKYLDFIDWAESVGKPPGSTIERNDLVEDYLKRKAEYLRTHSAHLVERIEEAKKTQPLWSENYEGETERERMPREIFNTALDQAIDIVKATNK